jgi:hypothetical protein
MKRAIAREVKEGLNACTPRTKMAVEPISVVCRGLSASRTMAAATRQGLSTAGGEDICRASHLESSDRSVDPIAHIGVLP